MGVRSATVCTTAVVTAALVVTFGCGGGGKSQPADPSTISEPQSPSAEGAQSSIEETAIDPADELAADGLPEQTPASADSPLEYPELPQPVESDGDEGSSEDAGSEIDTAEVDTSVTIIGAPSPDENREKPSLAEAAAAERRRRRTAPPTSIVITDKNLSDYAVGQLTVSFDDAETGSGGSSAELEKLRAEEEYWRSRGLEIRTAWAEAAERAEELEGEVFHLRQRFYAEDDGFYRDSQIKPAWDRAIELLQETNQEIEDRQQELAAYLEDGREAGALPGWLREGVDLEPKPEPQHDSIYLDPDRNELEVGEPVVVEEQETDSGN